MEAVTMGTYDAPRRAAALYAADGVLWGTEVHAPDDPLWGEVSEEIRDTPEKIYAYFDYFARLPKLRLVEYTPGPVRVHGDFAAQAGAHKFAWRGADGVMIEMRARFSFTFRRDRPDRPSNPWMIVEHFSSSMPAPPGDSKQAASASSTAEPSSPNGWRESTDATREASLSSCIESPPLTRSCSFDGSPAAAAAAALAATVATATDIDSALQTLDDLSEERQVRARQIANLQRRAERAECLAAQEAILRSKERLAGAKHDAELEERAARANRQAEDLAQKAESLAAELDALLTAESSEIREEPPIAEGTGDPFSPLDPNQQRGGSTDSLAGETQEGSGHGDEEAPLLASGQKPAGNDSDAGQDAQILL